MFGHGEQPESPGANEEQQQQLNYPVLKDNAFTPDQIEFLEEYKQSDRDKVKKHKSVLKGLEAAFWGISSYSIAKYLVMAAGSSGAWFAACLIVVMNQIVNVNKECLDELRIDYDQGIKVYGGRSVLKLLGGLVTTGVILYSALGEYYANVDISQQVSRVVFEDIDRYNGDIEKSNDLDQLVQIGGIAISLFVVYTSLNGAKR